MIRFQEVSYTYLSQGSEEVQSPCLDHISFHIPKGQCVVLCGKSGCGKTTLLRIINGLACHFYQGRLEGDISVSGMVPASASLPELARVVGSVFQNPRTQFFHTDTTGELAFQLENQNMPREQMRRRLDQVVTELGLESLMERSIFALSGGEKQQIACGSVYASMPQVVVLDEPSSNLDLEGIRKLRGLLETMKASGVTILVSEHRLWYLHGLADRYLLLESGKLRGDLTPEQMTALDPQTRQALGLRAVDRGQLFSLCPQARPKEWMEPGLELRSLFCLRGRREVLHISHLQIPKGAIVAVVGRNGAGKSTLLLTLSGLLRFRGTVKVDKEPTAPKALSRLSHLVMQEAGHQLFSDTVLGELTLNNPNSTEQDAREIMAALGLAGLESCHPGSLSGGQKQRLSLGVALASGRRLLLYDEPTSGQDGENLLRTAQQITSANQNAVCTLMVTHDPELIFQCATHILHLKDGTLQAFFPLNRDGVERLWQIFGASEFDEFDSERSLNNMKHLSVWDQLVQLPYLNLYGKVVSSALELDLFTHLQEKKTPAELAQAMGWNEANTGYLLATLGTYGFVQKEGDGYVNSQEAQKYLVRGTPDYLGGFIHFYGQNEGMVPMDVKKLLTEGPQPMPQMEMEQNLDFAQYGQMLRMSEEGYRQQEILRIVRELPENSMIRRVLDVGCAAGLLGLAVIGDGENRSGVLLDQIPSQIIQPSVDAAGLGERVKVMQGNFLTNDLGSGYDLILAVSVMLFAKGGMEPLMKKFFDALNPGGVLLVVSEGIAEDLSGPWDMMTGYLPYFLNGMDLAVRAGEVEAAARAAGFTKIESRTEQLCSGTQDILVIRK